MQQTHHWAALYAHTTKYIGGQKVNKYQPLLPDTHSSPSVSHHHPQDDGAYLFIDGIHFGFALWSDAKWYRFEFAASGRASGFNASGRLFSFSTHDVSVSHNPPTGDSVTYLGSTVKTTNEIITFALADSGFQRSRYSLNRNNCRHFSTALATFMGVEKAYVQAVRGYLFTGTPSPEVQWDFRL